MIRITVLTGHQRSKSLHRYGWVPARGHTRISSALMSSPPVAMRAFCLMTLPGRALADMETAALRRLGPPIPTRKHRPGLFAGSSLFLNGRTVGDNSGGVGKPCREGCNAIRATEPLRTRRGGGVNNPDASQLRDLTIAGR